MPKLLRRSVLALAIATMSAAAGPALAQTPEVTLFKVVSAKDELVIGIARDELAAMGGGAPVEAIARQIAKAGHMAVWNYAPRRDAQGAARLTPVQRVVIFANGIVRIEPHNADGPIQPPPR